MEDKQDRGEDFATHCWSFTSGKPIEGRVTDAQTAPSVTLSKNLKARGFKFVGPTIVYAWMQAVGITNDHLPVCFRRAQILEQGRPSRFRRRVRRRWP
ncbi:methyladenine glycosylase [Novosphingobium sp. PhB165]|uniref:DNA-3-methyladenine glycosylase I n=1 Tax=Novosphingobium sp. PhB165 TaxID=2485105 RepID=UPI00104AE855|nr:methyladenine glycosylase [Novosphingobium sp. PhB165]